MTPGPLGTRTGLAGWVALQLTEAGKTLARCPLVGMVAVLYKGHVVKLFEVGTTWRLTEVTEDLSYLGAGGGAGQHSAVLQVLKWSLRLRISVPKEACLLLFFTCPESAWVTKAIVRCLRLPSLSLHREQGSAGKELVTPA